MLGFGKCKPEDYEKIRSGSSEDLVEAGEYFVELTGLRHIEPRDGKPLGVFIVEMKTLETNAAPEFRGKQLEGRLMYCPDIASAPKEKQEGWSKMNDMTLTDIAQINEAANAEPVVDESGMLDLVATLQKLPDIRPKLTVTVTRREYEGRQRQEISNYRPYMG